MDNFWMDKKVLITGGTGFLGKHLADAVLQRQARVKIMDFRQPAWQISGMEFIESDITDKDKVFGACENIDIVFHLAAMPSIARAKFADYYRVNVLGTRNVLGAALRAKVKKCIYVSSSTVYGIPVEFPLKETSGVKPLGKYSGTKLEAERVCQEFVRQGLNICIIRPRVIMGPGRIGVFSILFDRIKQHQPVYIIGKGDNVFQFTHVFDLSRACMMAAEYASLDLFNIGSEETLPVKEELLALIKHANSKSRIISLPAKLTRVALKTLSVLGISPLVDEQFYIADKNFKLDIGYARKRLNWQPMYSNLDSLIQAYDWYIANIDTDTRQFKSICGLLGKFKHSKMGGFQNN